ncbi:unnamed protein product, partial [Urochloa humidicola]
MAALRHQQRFPAQQHVPGQSLPRCRHAAQARLRFAEPLRHRRRRSHPGATGEADFFDKDYPKVYTLAQCTPDQTPAQCRKCLAGVIASNLVEFKDRIGGRVLWFNCSWRYETAPFFNGPALVRLPSPSPAPAPVPALRPTVGPPTGGGRRKYSVPVVVLAVVLPTLAALNLTVCFCFWKRRRPIAQAQKPGMFLQNSPI